MTLPSYHFSVFFLIKHFKFHFSLVLYLTVFLSFKNMDRVSEDNNLEKSCDTPISNATWSSPIHSYWTPLLIVLVFSWEIHGRLASHYHYWQMCYRGALELSACPDKMSDIILALYSDKTQNISHNGAGVQCLHSVSRVFFPKWFMHTHPQHAGFHTHTRAQTLLLPGGRKEQSGSVDREGLSPSVVQSETKVRH